MVTIEIAYQGKLRCQAVHGPSRTVLVTDAPVDNHGRGESFSPTDLVATALGVCMATVMGIVAERDGIPLADAAVHVEKHMTTTPPRRIARLVVAFAMPAGISGSQRGKLEHAARTCPVKLSIHPEIEVDLSFTYPD
jgi:putative redox protein